MPHSQGMSYELGLNRQDLGVPFGAWFVDKNI
jgi:hypothetical protein